ncbi:MAG: NYN domain-containing protein, partial [Candidatus Vogelbacteria bacterium]|nr:NYN domain-containing protein [Candidatus Vogelbacteria bacterium]
DVEIAVDAIRLLDKYDTFCLFSGDSDFTYLVRYLKKNKKKFIVIASGQVFHTLAELADLYINAQDIKAEITTEKKTASLARRGLDIGSVSDGQGNLSTTDII